MKNWQIKHGKVINDFLQFMNSKTDDYILKGGTALMTCYQLDRFSEDIDLDSKNKNLIKNIVETFCKQYDYPYRIAKDTDTVKRFMIHYTDGLKPLKIEISYRSRNINKNDIDKINGISVYKINRLAYMKCNAYNSRDKIRDLYDITFICKNYYNQLSDDVKGFVCDAFQYKGLEQFDYLIATQSDELIDNDKLAEDILDVYDKLGLIAEKDDPDIEL
jgi:predicted nucleotidyltransferase component of viral defense system